MTAVFFSGQFSNSGIVGLNAAPRLDAFPRLLCVRVLGRGFVLSRYFVQRLVPNTEQTFRSQECNSELQHIRRCNVSELGRIHEKSVITVRLIKMWFCRLYNPKI
jgi:hypothetical protein